MECRKRMRFSSRQDWVSDQVWHGHFMFENRTLDSASSTSKHKNLHIRLKFVTYSCLFSMCSCATSSSLCPLTQPSTPLDPCMPPPQVQNLSAKVFPTSEFVNMCMQTAKPPSQATVCTVVSVAAQPFFSRSLKLLHVCCLLHSPALHRPVTYQTRVT